MKRFLVAMTAIAALAMWPLACDDGPQSHVYVASLYEPVNNCLDPSTSLGTIATSTGNLDCAPTCIVLPLTSGAAKIYVSTMCGPYPTAYDVSQTDPSCPAALTAWAAGGPNSCANPPTSDAAADGPGSDGAGEGSAGDDGSTEGGVDGAGDDGAADGSGDDAGNDGSNAADAHDGDG